MNKFKAKAETVRTLRFDRKVWTGPRFSSLIVYALDTGHLALAPEPVPEYEKKALFREKAPATVKNGEYLIEFSGRIFDFYHLDETDYTVAASETKPRTVEILL